MAKYMIAYVCPGVNKRDPSWVLGALANDESGLVVEPNPQLDVPAAAAGTGLTADTLRHWADSLRGLAKHVPQELFDEAQKRYVEVPPTDPRYLGLVAGSSVGEWNYYYSP